MNPRTLTMTNLLNLTHTTCWPETRRRTGSLRASVQTRSDEAGSQRVAPYLDHPPAYSPRNTKAVPAHIRPMLKGRPAAAMRCRVRLSPITTKPAKVKMFIPKRMSLVNIAPCYDFWDPAARARSYLRYRVEGVEP